MTANARRARIAEAARIIAHATYCETVNHHERVAARIVALLSRSGSRRRGGAVRQSPAGAGAGGGAGAYQ